MMQFLLEMVEYIAGKEENARYQAFSGVSQIVIG